MVDIFRYQILFYQTANGSCPTEDFLNSLPVKVRTKISRWIERLEICGPDLPRPYADIIRDKIRELRIVFASQQYRLLYFFHGRYIVITHGFIKKTSGVPIQEMEKAQNIIVDFQFRIRNGDIII
ncbi:MAG: type II toxin-antitoxin system RelE/ParE family toxin [Candidatus Omnitrophica bacterium]|jgi:phage-related protein|nr:type II toxin-antitoxin system RelE/ParE family toxin [Candidatus Omnitrophota bacterium]